MILTALLTFQYANETSHSKSDNTTPSSPTSAIARIASISVAGMSDKPPPPPPKPAPKTGIDRIAEMQAATGDYNEVTIEDEGSIEDYARYCSKLLEVRGGIYQLVVHSYSYAFLRMMLCSSSL